MITIYPGALEAAHEGLADYILAAGSTPHLVLKDAGSTVLADLPLDSYTTNPATGQLTWTWGTGGQVGLDTGTAVTGEIQDESDVVHIDGDVIQSSAPVADSFAMTTTQVVTGQPVSGISFTIG